MYKIRNARWPKWYMYIRSSDTQLRVREGSGSTNGPEYQWTVLTPPMGTSYLMFTEQNRDLALTYGSRRLCTEIRDGVELELMNASDDEFPDDDQEPGPDGLQPEGLGLNGEEIEPITENAEVREAEIAGREDDDDYEEMLWFEDEEDESLENETADVNGSVAEVGELSSSHRSRSYYSARRRRDRRRRRRDRRRFYSGRSRSYSSSRSRSYYYSRSRSTTYYYRSRTYYSRSRNFNSYNYYYNSYYYAAPRRRVYCRNVPVPTGVNVETAGASFATLGMKFEVAPVGSGVPGLPLYMISASAYPGKYLFVPRFSSGVDIHNGDPGAGAYWFFDPPLPSDDAAVIPNFAGRRCSWFCANPGNIAGSGGSFVDGAHRPGKVVALFASGVAAASAFIFCTP